MAIFSKTAKRTGITFYYIRFQDQDGRRHVEQAGTTPTQAKELLKIRRGEVAAGTYIDPRKDSQGMTFGALVDKFTANYRTRGETDWYHGILKPVREFFETTPVSDVQSADLDRYLAHRRLIKRKSDEGRRVSESSLRKEIIATATCFKWAKRNGYVQSNPADADSMPRPAETFDPQSVRWLTDDELKALLGVAPPWLNQVIVFATETGMDKGKLRRLRLAELDLERIDGRIVAGRFAMLRSKTGKPIRQVLSDGAVKALNAAGRVKNPSGVVFLDEDGQPIAEKVLDWALSCAYKAAKITGCNFRTFRHTYATRALRRGVPREVVAMTMGHASAHITATYQHVADDQLEAAAAAMSGPERLRGKVIPPVAGDRMANQMATYPGPNGELADGSAEQAVAQGFQARRGAGVAEQGCLLSSYTR